MTVPATGTARQTRPRRAVLAVLAGLVGLAGAVVTTGPALAHDRPPLAHGADAPAGTDYRGTVSGLRPAVPGVRVRLIEAGARLELVNGTGRAIEVLGYAGEPYLEVRPDGVYENANSPAAYTNRTLAGDTPVPPGATPTSSPQWRKVTDEPVARWHDRRIRWAGDEVPEPVRADPGRPHRVAEWTVPLRDGARDVELRGTVDWLPPPHPGRWWLAGLIGAGLIGTLGLVGAAGTARRTLAYQKPAPARTAPVGGARADVARAGTAALCMAAGIGAVALAIARVGDGTATGFAGTAAGLLAGSRWTTLSGLAALAAGAYALIRRSPADFATTLTGVCVGTFAGVTNGAAFSSSVVPAAWSPAAYRWLVLMVIVLGYGAAVASVLRLRSARLAGGATPDSGTTPDADPGAEAGPDDQRGPAPATRGSNP